MKILYFAPEHISGTLTTMRHAHQSVGDECRFLTMFSNNFAFDDDIALDLPWSPTGGWFARAKEWRRRWKGLTVDPERPTPPGHPPAWHPDDGLAQTIFKLREAVWTPHIERARKQYQLDEFDVYQFEMGVEFYRDGRWVNELKRRGKGLVAFYHGTDVRNRGVILPVDEACGLRLSSELDLLELHPKLEYLFLPIDISGYKPIPFEEKPSPIKIGHAARSRKLKGTDYVIRAIENLKRRGYDVELVLMENLPHAEVVKKKKECHIAVDQLTDLGGWGYGMSSLEFAASGIPIVTRMRPEYERFLPDHPFVNADETNVESALEKLIADSEFRRQKGIEARKFVERYHDVKVVLRQYYDYLVREGMISTLPKLLQTVQSPVVRR